MNNYFDQYGRTHHKPVTEVKPVPSNNGWIYTAYFVKAGGEVNKMDLQICYNASIRYTMEKQLSILRSPGVESPPMSRDEILGMAYLGVLKPWHLDGWSFSPRPIPTFNPFKLISQAVELYGKHRNHFWENHLDQIYRFAFSVPLTDRYFILECYNSFKWYKPSHLFYAAVAKLDSVFGGESGIRYLKYGRSKQAMMKEFPTDHPILDLK